MTLPSDVSTLRFFPGGGSGVGIVAASPRFHVDDLVGALGAGFLRFLGIVVVAGASVPVVAVALVCLVVLGGGLASVVVLVSAVFASLVGGLSEVPEVSVSAEDDGWRLAVDSG